MRELRDGFTETLIVDMYLENNTTIRQGERVEKAGMNSRQR